MKWSATLHHHMPSMKNSRITTRSGASIKSKGARKFETKAGADALVVRPPRLLRGPLSLELKIYYGHPLNDIDHNLIMDVLEGIVYENDHEVYKVKMQKWHVPRKEARVEIVVEELEPRPD